MTKAFIFDMDGLMIDSEPYHFKAYEDVLAEYGIHYSEQLNRKYIGRSDIEVCNELVNVLHLTVSGSDLLKLKKKKYAHFLKNEISTKDGLFEILESLSERKYLMALASSSPIDEIKLVLKKFNLSSYFKVVVSGEFVEKSKPEPDIFILAAKKLNIRSDMCLVLEDSYNGMLAAKRANMACFVIPDKEKDHSRFEKANRIFTSLTEVKDFVMNNINS